MAIESVRTEAPAPEFEAVHERSTAHRLALHFELGGQFETWNIDCEYDRNELQLRKMLHGVAGCGTRGKATDEVVPDVIIHHRGGAGCEHNLLVVELKKQAGLDPCDDQKLKLFTAPNGHYQYQVGLYININAGGFDCTWGRNGAQLH